MINSENYKARVAYLRKPQEESLKNIKDTIKEEYGLSIPIAEIIRDSIDKFIENEGNNLKEYVERKGF
jgi:hypothetical protein